MKKISMVMVCFLFLLIVGNTFAQTTAEQEARQEKALAGIMKVNDRQELALAGIMKGYDAQGSELSKLAARVEALEKAAAQQQKPSSEQSLQGLERRVTHVTRLANRLLARQIRASVVDSNGQRPTIGEVENTLRPTLVNTNESVFHVQVDRAIRNAGWIVVDISGFMAALEDIKSAVALNGTELGVLYEFIDHKVVEVDGQDIRVPVCNLATQQFVEKTVEEKMAENLQRLKAIISDSGEPETADRQCGSPEDSYRILKKHIEDVAVDVQLLSDKVDIILRAETFPIASE